MKLKKIFLPLLLFVTCLFPFTACGSQDDVRIDEAEVQEFIADFERNSPFVDNQVLVVLTEEVTFKRIFHDYTVKDFSGIGAIEVEELDGSTADSKGLTDNVRSYLFWNPSGNTLPGNLKHYQRIFCITLDKKDKDNVLRAVYILRQRPEIRSAEPNWITSAA